MDRRDFLHNCGHACLLLFATPLVIGGSGCSATTVVQVSANTDRTVDVPVSALVANGRAIVRCEQLSDDMLVTRNVQGEWRALLMRCTHRDQPLVAVSNGLVCNSHGSRFDLDGLVTKAPAVASLHLYRITEHDDHLTIHLTNDGTTNTTRSSAKTE